MPAYRIQPHLSQFASSNTSITKSSGCTWTTGANGANASTGARVTPDRVHAQVKRAEETNPRTPGWSMRDLSLAMRRLGVPFEDRSGAGWAAVVAYHDAGYYLAVQGDSDQFGNQTCSGIFDGDHCIGVHPEEDERGWWLINDPICKKARFEDPRVIKRYATDLADSIYFGQFTTKVRIADGLRLRYGARKTTPYPDRTRADGPGTSPVRIHSKPDTSDATVVGTLKEGALFIAYQVTDEGANFNGSTTWYGNKTGDKWVNSRRLRREGGTT